MGLLRPHLQQLAGIIQWNVDLQDVDKVLRVVGNNIPADLIKKSLEQAGHSCEELQD